VSPVVGYYLRMGALVALLAALGFAVYTFVDALDRAEDAEIERDAWKDKAEQAQQTMLEERQARSDNERVIHALRIEKEAAVAASRGSADRLRKLAEDYADATSACRGGDAPEVARLHESTRSDLVALTDDANRCASDLTSLQRYIREVIAPHCPIEGLAGQ
jgi:hypothetical protein